MAVAFERGDTTRAADLAEAAAIAGVGRGRSAAGARAASFRRSPAGRAGRLAEPDLAPRRPCDASLADLDRLRMTPRRAPAAAADPRAAGRRRRPAPARRRGQRPARSRDALRRRRRRRDGALRCRRVGPLAVRRDRGRPFHARRPPRPDRRGHRLGRRRSQADAPAAGLAGDPDAEVVVLRDATVDTTTRGSTRRLPPERHPQRLLRPDRLPRRAARPARPLPRRHPRLDDGRDRRSPAASPTRWPPAIGNARLYESVQSLAARLEAVQDLALRLNRTRDLDEIAAVIVEGTERLIEHDSIRVYRVDHETQAVRADRVQGHVRRRPEPELRRAPHRRSARG